MLFYNKALIKEKGAKRGVNTIGLDVVGVDNALAEALVVQTALSILKDEGYKHLNVEINAIGDRESVKKFEKELLVYYKSRLDDLKAPEKKKIQSGNPIDVFCCEKDYLQSVNEEAPQAHLFSQRNKFRTLQRGARIPRRSEYALRDQ